MAEAFIKIYNKMLNWEWYDDKNTRILFIHCLLRANWKSGSWHGIDYKAGEFITSLPTLATETCLSVRQVRVALDHLKLTGELTDRRQGNVRIITVVKWNEYQSCDRPNDIPMTDQCQTNDRPMTADKEYKNIKNIKNKEYKNNIKRFIPPSLEEVRAYCEERKNRVDPQHFIDFYASKGWMVGKNHMKDWKASVRTWERRDNNGPSNTGNTRADEDYTAIDETIRRIESGEADHDDDGLWD